MLRLGKACPGMSNLCRNNKVPISPERTELFCLFAACSYTSMEVTILVGYGLCVLVLWNDKLPISLETIEMRFGKGLHLVRCTLELQNLLFCVGIVRYRLSGNQIFRCFKLKKVKDYMRYQDDFLLLLKLQRYAILDDDPRILLANQFAAFFTFDLFDLFILIPRVHCYIVHFLYVSDTVRIQIIFINILGT